MCRLLQDYLDDLEQAANSQQLREAFARVAIGFELPLFAYIAMPTTIGQQLRLISNYPPPWQEHYRARRYETCDPVVFRLQRDPKPFEWSSDLAHGCQYAGDFFGEAAEFGIKFGYTIPIRYWRGRFAAVTFATDIRHPTFCNAIRRHEKALESIALQLHLSVCDKLQVWRPVGNVMLTPREYQCLKWASRGKSYCESAELLGIAPRTVKFHIENAKAKFGVTKVREAVLLFVAYEQNASGTAAPMA